MFNNDNTGAYDSLRDEVYCCRGTRTNPGSHNCVFFFRRGECYRIMLLHRSKGGTVGKALTALVVLVAFVWWAILWAIA